MLPPLKVLLADRFGNPVAMRPTLTPPAVSIIATIPAAAGGGGWEECEELRVAAQQEAGAEGIVISQLQLLGPELPSGVGAGMQLLQRADGLTHPSARQAQARASQQSLPAAEVQLRIGLQAGQEGLEPEVLGVRLRAGAPRSLQLLPGNPWQAAGAGDAAPEAAVTVPHGSALPAFSCQALDAWGNRTAPAADLAFALLAECAATAPQAKEHQFNAAGIAVVEGAGGSELVLLRPWPAGGCNLHTAWGLAASKHPRHLWLAGLVCATSTVAAGDTALQLSLKCAPANPSTAAALAVATPQVPLM